MKNLLKFILLTAWLSFSYKARSQSVCVQYLNDFIPKTTDSTLVVKLRFLALTPDLYPGVWSTNHFAQAQSCVRKVDSIYANIQTPKIAISGVPFISQTKIKFVVSSWDTLANSNYYTNVFNTVYQNLLADTTAINVMLGFGFSTTASTPIYPGNVVSFEAPNSQDITTLTFAFVLAHELGHALGLSHSTASLAAIGTSTATRPGDGPTHAYPKTGCCTTLTPTDYKLEDTLFYFECWDALGSNNMMSDVAACNRYFSPQQMAVMHYHLRTDMKGVLTSFSYNNHISRNAALDDSITVDQSFTNDRYFKGWLKVKSGKKLTVYCQVGMAKGTKIIVEKGALLVVDGGTLTNISGQMWDGVQVEGDPALDQSISLTTGLSNQGILRVEYSGVISNAGTATMNYLTNGSGVMYGTVGGIIRGDHALFLNNRRDAEFLAHWNYPSASRFTYCEFKTTRKLNEGIPFSHVSMWGLRGISFLGCNFEYAAGGAYNPTDRGNGILSMDANYYVDRACASSSSSPCYTETKCTFKKLTTGINALNSNVNRFATVSNSRFEDNIIDGIHFQNSNSFILNNNYFNITESASNGIYLNSCRFYTVKSNTLEDNNYAQTNSGMIVYNSKKGPHQVYRNSFAGLNYALRAVNDNSGYGNVTNGLLMNCNDFTASPNVRDILMLGAGMGLNAPTVMRKQGDVSIYANVNNVVRNKYGATCNGQSKWAAIGAGTSTLNIKHGTNSDAVTQPTPQPACSNTIVNVVAIPFALNYTLHCPVSLPSNGGIGTVPQLMSNVNTNISAQRALGVDKDVFELQANLSSKIRIFAMDSLEHGNDSIISTLTDNSTLIDDADIQLVFAHINNGDFTSASEVTDGMGLARADWATLLNTLIEIYQEPNGIYSITDYGTNYTTLVGFASTEGKDGREIAQALLYFVLGETYDEPRPEPEIEEGRKAKPTETGLPLNLEAGVKIYPNPSKTGITVAYNDQKVGEANIEIRDLLGKLIYAGNLINGTNNFVSLVEVHNGVYIVRVTKNKELLYTCKLVKQD